MAHAKQRLPVADTIIHFDHFQRCRWLPVHDRHALAQAALSHILSAANLALNSRGRFLFVLAGGETPKQVYSLLPHAATDWGKWHLYFSDERRLPADDERRNSTMARHYWLDKVNIPATQIHPIPAELDAAHAVRAYTETLRRVGEFDLVLLGLGEDGHTASLFPGHDWGSTVNSHDVLSVSDAPKPPPERITLSAARLSRSRQVLFLVAGEEKHQAVTAWRKGDPIPARSISPLAGVDILVEAALLREGGREKGKG
ncbi:MAG TPA: 6-phosphogluconolactonase [Rhodocyclaceae bacterium]|nr:6-phosphogluconolactonase [Rhodocyclaceae bacterium]